MIFNDTSVANRGQIELHSGMGSGIFVGGAGDKGGRPVVKRLETEVVYNDGKIAPGAGPDYRRHKDQTGRAPNPAVWRRLNLSGQRQLGCIWWRLRHNLMTQRGSRLGDWIRMPPRQICS